jgi:hypothetical protein
MNVDNQINTESETDPHSNSSTNTGQQFDMLDTHAATTTTTTTTDSHTSHNTHDDS